MSSDRFARAWQRFGYRSVWLVPFSTLDRWAAVVWSALRRVAFNIRVTGGIARGTRVEADVRITTGARFEMGGLGHIGQGGMFEIDPAAAGVRIGRNVWISRGSHVACAARITVGDDVMIGEYVSLRDGSHSTGRTDIPMKGQPDIAGSIDVESDVWIGRGVLVQSPAGGLRIGRGSIIAANSVVRASIGPFEIWGGVPARLIRSRIGDARG